MHALEQFNEDGYTILENVLSQHELDKLDVAIDRHVDEHPEDLSSLKPGYTDLCTPHRYSEVFDLLIEHPATLELLREILGEAVALEEILVTIREPTPDLEEFKGWHRDLIRDYDRRHEIPYVSVAFYLTDVSEHLACDLARRSRMGRGGRSPAPGRTERIR